MSSDPQSVLPELASLKVNSVPSRDRSPSPGCLVDCGDSCCDKTDEKDTKSDGLVDFDDSYLKEIEADLTEEQLKERHQQALDLKSSGNARYQDRDWKEASNLYTQALHVCPLAESSDRAVLFANRAACRMKQDYTDLAIKDCSKALELNPSYMKAMCRRAQLYHDSDKLDEALTDYKWILERDPRNREAFEACQRLPDQINQRNEKLKTEMLGKLKDLGNLVLKPFGLSTDNFQVQQDPSTGSYNIAFNQNSRSS